jgi:hypothetical protein
MFEKLCKIDYAYVSMGYFSILSLVRVQVIKPYLISY